MATVIILVALMLWLLRIALLRRRRVRAGFPVSGPWHWPRNWHWPRRWHR
jgi:hypothetical protein